MRAKKDCTAFFFPYKEFPPTPTVKGTLMSDENGNPASSDTPAAPNAGPSPSEAPAGTHPAVHRRKNSDTRFVAIEKLILGGIALLLWLLLFSAGLLIDTMEARLTLAPHAVARQLGTSAPADFAEIQTRAAKDSRLVAFVRCMFCYTPINLALLTIVAGLTGGCASNISVAHMKENERKELGEARARYLEEPPASATIRGFVVYLCVIAGLYIVTEDPFRDPTASQYIRLAGTLSVLGFIVGYDPSRLIDWLSIVPSPMRLAGNKDVPQGETSQVTTVVKREVLQAKEVVKQEQTFEHPLPESHAEAEQQAAHKEEATPAVNGKNGAEQAAKEKLAKKR